MHWTATRQGASVTFSSGEMAWDFSPFVHLVCEVQNLADNELFVECHLDGDYWSTGAGYVPARSTKKIETLILRKEYSKQQLELFPKMNGLLQDCGVVIVRNLSIVFPWTFPVFSREMRSW